MSDAPKKKRKPLYLQVHIGPFGFREVGFKILGKKPTSDELCAVTRGEGSVLVFRLVDGDYATNFYEALCEGTVLKDLGNKTIYADISKAIEEIRARYCETCNKFIDPSMIVKRDGVLEHLIIGKDNKWCGPVVFKEKK